MLDDYPGGDGPDLATNRTEAPASSEGASYHSCTAAAAANGEPSYGAPRTAPSPVGTGNARAVVAANGGSGGSTYHRGFASALEGSSTPHVGVPAVAGNGAGALIRSSTAPLAETAEYSMASGSSGSGLHMHAADAHVPPTARVTGGGGHYSVGFAAVGNGATVPPPLPPPAAGAGAGAGAGPAAAVGAGAAPLLPPTSTGERCPRCNTKVQWCICNRQSARPAPRQSGAAAAAPPPSVGYLDVDGSNASDETRL